MEALHRLQLAVVGMEYFGSRPQKPLDVCLAAVRECHAYIGIFAMRNGSIDSSTGKSIAQLEYQEAQRHKIPSLVYLLDEERQPILPKFVDIGESAERLKRFKAELKNKHVVSFFTTPDDLAKRIILDLPPLAELAGIEVRHSELSKIVTAIPRIDWLNEERMSFLVQELGPQATFVSDRRILREVLEFLLSGDRQAAVFLLARTSHPNIREAIDYAMQVESTLRAVLERGTKILREQEEKGSA
jgi:hypothetical protein